jgi:group I intron endonuclease
MIIYKTTNLLNNKIYIGQDSNNNPKYLGSGLLLKKAIIKYGKDNFKKEIIEFCDNKKHLNEREKYWIEEFKSMDKSVGYNLSEGGFGGNTYTEETKKKISDMMKNRIVSEETRKKMSNARKGTIHTTESKTKMSIAHKGKILSNEHIEKIRENSKNSIKSEEFLDNVGNITKYWPKGSKHTEETKNKMSEYHKENPVRFWLNKKRDIISIEKAKESNKDFKHSKEHKEKIKGSGNPFYGKEHTEEAKMKISNSRNNKTPEQKLETYIKFYITRKGCKPTDEVLELKLIELRNKNV